MFEADLLRFADSGRLAADGVPFEILSEAIPDVQGGRGWRDVWEEVSDRLERHAEEALQRTAPVSAAELLWQAALAAHVSQLHSYEDLNRRERAEQRRRFLYQRAIVIQPVPGDQITLMCAGIETSGYLRVPPQTQPPQTQPPQTQPPQTQPPQTQPPQTQPPQTQPPQARPAPCLILLGGLDSTKEESLRFENYCLSRGMATFVFDGPGQGETRLRAPLGSSDFLAWIKEAMAILAAHPDIDRDRIGILGRSMGGHYALRAAADTPGLKCCVAWSPLGDCGDWDRYPEAIKWGFRYAVGMPDMREARKAVEAELVLGSTLSRISVPTLVTHGRRDAIVPPDQQDEMRAGSSNSVHYEMVSAGNHCCHNLAFLLRPMMADWAAAQLRASAPEAD